MCLLDEGPMTRSSNGPATANRLGPASPNCQAFMAEYCANKWDKYCDIYYKKNATESIRAFPNTFAVRSSQFSDNLGDSLLKNAAQLRFFKTNCNATYKEPLDPTNYSSPMITRFINQRSMDGAQLNTRTMNSRSIDKDPLMQRMLANPNAVQQELKAIHSLSRSSGFQRSGGGKLNQTSTGKILNQYFGN
jgi:hypothetical protein